LPETLKGLAGGGKRSENLPGRGTGAEIDTCSRKKAKMKEIRKKEKVVQGGEGVVGTEKRPLYGKTREQRAAMGGGPDGFTEWGAAGVLPNENG